MNVEQPRATVANHMFFNKRIRCHREAVPEISRGLSAATPPETVRITQCTPEGC